MQTDPRPAPSEPALYAIKCIGCREEIGRTDSLTRSAAGGLCDACRPPDAFPNPHEQAARAKKAATLALAAQRLGFKAEDLERADAEDREKMAAIAGTRIPSEKTWKLVVSALRREEEKSRRGELLSLLIDVTDALAQTGQGRDLVERARSVLAEADPFEGLV